MTDGKYLAHVARLALVAIALSMASLANAECGNVYRSTLMETNAGTEEVSTETVRRILRDGGAILIDSRSRAEYSAGHIPGARNVSGPPGDAVATVEILAGGDKTKALVLYCNGPFCKASRRLSKQLAAAGYTNVRRYQLGMPIWRALGGPTEIEAEGLLRVYGRDRTAVFLDARSASEFAKGTLPGAHSVPADELAAGSLKKAPLPEDDFNTRIIIFGRDAGQARKLAEALSTRPWHNVSYVAGSFEDLETAIK